MKRNRAYSRQLASELHRQGYRQVSRKFGIIARVPMSDEELTQFLKEREFGGAGRVYGAPIRDQRNIYRRVFSDDTIKDVPQKVLRELRALGD